MRSSLHRFYALLHFFPLPACPRTGGPGTGRWPGRGAVCGEEERERESERACIGGGGRAEKETSCARPLSSSALSLTLRMWAMTCRGARVCECGRAELSHVRARERAFPSAGLRVWGRTSRPRPRAFLPHCSTFRTQSTKPHHARSTGLALTLTHTLSPKHTNQKNEREERRSLPVFRQLMTCSIPHHSDLGTRAPAALAAWGPERDLRPCPLHPGRRGLDLLHRDLPLRSREIVVRGQEQHAVAFLNGRRRRRGRGCECGSGLSRRAPAGA